MSWGTAASAGPLTPGSEPSAEDKETARNAYHVGVQRFRAKDYHGALQAFEAADRIMGVPTTGLEVGRTRAVLGLLVEARDRLLQVTRRPVRPDEPRPFREARLEASRLAEEVARRIPSIEIRVAGPDGPLPEHTPVDIRIDGKALEPDVRGVPRRLNPGFHTVQVSAAGFAQQRQAITLREGDQRVVQFTMMPAQPGSKPPVGPGSAPPPTSGPDGDQVAPTGISPLVYVGFSVGGAGLLVGTITGIATLSSASSLEDECPDKKCPPEQQDELDEATTMGHVSTASFIVGGVGVAVGLVGMVLSDWNGKGSDSLASGAATTVRIQPLLGPGSVGLRGTF